MFVDPSAACPSIHSSCSSLVAGRFAFSICLPTHLPFVFSSSSRRRRLPARRMPLIIYSLIHRRHDRLGGGRVVRRTNVDAERLRFIAVGHRQSRQESVGVQTTACPDSELGYSDPGRPAKLPVMITDETIYLGDHPTPAVVCHRRWKCDSAIMWSCIVVVVEARPPACPADRCNDRQQRS